MIWTFWHTPYLRLLNPYFRQSVWACNNHFSPTGCTVNSQKVIDATRIFDWRDVLSYFDVRQTHAVTQFIVFWGAVVTVDAYTPREGKHSTSAYFAMYRCHHFLRKKWIYNIEYRKCVYVHNAQVFEILVLSVVTGGSRVVSQTADLLWIAQMVLIAYNVCKILLNTNIEKCINDGDSE